MAKNKVPSARTSRSTLNSASAITSQSRAAKLEQSVVDGIEMQLWRTEGSSDIDIKLLFRTIENRRSSLTVSRDWRRRPASVLAELEKKGAILIENPLPSLSQLLMSDNLQVHSLVPKPGWHGKTFVLAGRWHRVATGTKSQHLIAPVAAYGHAYVGHYRGDAAGWRERVGMLAQQSTTMSFAILVSLAAPLAARADLSEGALFNFFAESSTGKTTLARVAASVAGNPDLIGDWDFTPRGIQERAAAHNGYAVILDDTEKVPGGLPVLVRSVTHILTGGQSKTYSASVHDKLKSLTWFCFGLSTSPEGMNALALRSKTPRTAGAQVRLIDLPVPAAAQGGAFDRLAEGAGTTIERAKSTIDQLEEAIREQHGELFRSWRKVFMKMDLDKIKRRIAAFEVAHPAIDNLDGRLVRKFAVVKVVGDLAVQNGVLDWSAEFVREIVDQMLAAARQQINKDTDRVVLGWKALAVALKDDQKIATVGPGAPLEISYESLLGISKMHKGVPVVAFFTDKITALFGGNVNAFLTPIRAEEGIIFEGARTDTATVQIAFTAENGRPCRPRVYAVKASAVDSVTRQQIAIIEARQSDGRAST